jgi:putative intracellular protease/amidase
MNKDKPLQTAILLYPGVTALDAVGPMEVFSRIPNIEMRFVGKETGPVVTEGDPLLLGVTHAVAETPSPDLVLVPGGMTTHEAAGAAGTRHSPRPPWAKAKCTTRALRAAGS